MIHWTYRRGVAAAALALGSAVVARAAEPTVQDLQQQVKELSNEVQDLKAKQNQNSADVAKTIDSLIRDAESRSKLLVDSGGMSAGFDNGRFFIGSTDGAFLLRPWIHLQFRGIVNDRSEAKSTGNDDVESGFELRRARFGFDGNFTKDITYQFNFATNRGSGSANVNDPTGAKIGSVNNGQGGLPVLEEAWARYNISGPYYIRAGQFHDPLAHEAIVGSKYEITAERSLQNDIFANTDTFTQGVTFIWDPKEDWRFEGGVTDGIRAANTNFQDQPNNFIQYNYGIAGRLEYKYMGDWADYNQITAYGNKKDLLVFGAGIDYSESGSSSSLTHAFDVQYGSTSGLFAYVSYIGRYTSNTRGIPSGGPVSTTFISPEDPGKDTYEPSILGQISYATGQWEPFLRYEYMHLQGTPAGSNNDVHEITGGVNYWIHGHNAKLVTQVMYLPNGIPIDDSSSDVLISNGQAEWVFTTQFQLLL